MSGRHRLHSGELRRASQRHVRPAVPQFIRIEIPWRPGDRVLWRDKTGVYRREVDEENAFIEIDGRVYRVRRAELRHG
jgi:hypothetical protein